MDRSFEVYLGMAMSQWVQRMTKRRIDWLCAQARGFVLDIGCGQGLVPWLLASRGLRVIGVDMDAEALGWARENLAPSNPAVWERITFVHGDFATFNSQEKFDTIIAGEYLEHLPDEILDKHLQHISSLLAPGGVVAITTPLGLHPHPDHYQTFFPRNLAEKLSKYFSIRSMDVQDCYFRCLCDLSTPKLIPDQEELLYLSERGIQQAQEREYARMGLKVKTPPPPQKSSSCIKRPVVKDNIEDYLHEKHITEVSLLQKKLAERGIHTPFVYDVRLFKELNSLYADKPLVPSPRSITPEGLFAQADSRVSSLLKMLPSFAGLKCLEVGCGRGETSVRLAERGGCDVVGVDITQYDEWEERWSKQTRFLPIDITYDAPFPPNSFDFIFSFVVLEHVAAPLDMLTALHRLLKPGGRLYFTANLYRGPMASHRYREVFFPWPHLLFDDEVFEQFYKQEGYTFSGKPAWVNKLIHLHYLEHVKSLGFTILECNYTRRPLDKDFYLCFEEKLGRYPVNDLELDFIKMLLCK